MRGHETLDARGIAQEHGGDELLTLQEVMTALLVWLVLVGDQERRGGEVSDIGDVRPASIRARVEDDEVVAHEDAKPVTGLGDPPVAGVPAGTAS